MHAKNVKKGKNTNTNNKQQSKHLSQSLQIVSALGTLTLKQVCTEPQDYSNMKA